MQPRYARPRQPVWPAYLVAAFCFIVAIVTTLSNLALTSQVHQLETQIARSDQRSSSLASTLAIERTMLSDLMNAQARHYDMVGGQVIVSNGRLYLMIRDLPMPPRGKVYQAWTLAQGAKLMAPSVTFIPDTRGVGFIAIPDIDATKTSAVAVSVEPDGGSKEPTTKLVANVALN